MKTQDSKHTKSYNGYVNSDIIHGLQKQNENLLKALKECVKSCNEHPISPASLKWSIKTIAEQAIKENS